MARTVIVLLNGDFRVWSLVGNLAQPLFQGGRLRAGVDRADAAGREALAVYVGRVLDAFAEVESSLAAEQRLAEQERHLAEAATQLRSARELAEERYRAGVGFYLVVLESQTRALTAESQRLSLRRRGGASTRGGWYRHQALRSGHAADHHESRAGT